MPIEPGLVDHKLSFEEVDSFIKTGKLDELGRLRAPLMDYRAQLEQLKEKYHTVGDLMLSTIFGFELRAHSESGKLEAVWPSPVIPMTVWKLNDFPYALEDGLEHHCLWSTEFVTEQHVLDAIEKERVGYDCVHWINPSHLKSIGNVHHAHIISRKQ
ncbi:hypothetical protein CYMTET_8372 [Cymbomonas tetramitiformis]|uniref:Uncharacterized protein n=1 Tax=Cymbomonas tetramitiformis TaxID=36881 RepID=A0AAE0LBR0_9CHLO|nr:hypothetical protein CYMTET_12555 [Cymbomonas tetramitiformis]KAK3283952.1 hypothetical protein CYMTET_8372 [Cymbomonas tetramitiformis]